MRIFQSNKLRSIATFSYQLYYDPTACPNPFIKDFIQHYGRPYDSSEGYKREPYAADVSEGKSTPIYNAHSYHTKVPHKAIMRYLLHYTSPGDVVFDGFSGSGMTGVAAQLCGDRHAVEGLGYKVLKDGSILEETSKGEQGSSWEKISELGARLPVVSDLAPIGGFISHAYNSPRNGIEYFSSLKSAYAETLSDKEWMYTTLHLPSEDQINLEIENLKNGSPAEEGAFSNFGKINYIIWSDVLSCGECGNELIFWEHAVDLKLGKVRDKFNCTNCSAELSKKNTERVWKSSFDQLTREFDRQAKQVPVYISYTYAGKRYEKSPDAYDLAIVEFISGVALEDWIPIKELPEGFNTAQPIKSHGLDKTYKFYTPRAQHVLSQLRGFGIDLWAPFSALTPRATRLHRIAASRLGGPRKGDGGATVGVLNGTLYMPSLSVEMNILDQAKDRIKAFQKADYTRRDCAISTQSTTDLQQIPSDSLDYVFVDPPFGSNINYSELSILWESWLKVYTNNRNEAIENKTQNKGADEYRDLMTRCFKEIYRILKPGRWMTVEFSNTKASVWNNIQVSISEAGFIIANVSALDKKQGSFKAITTPTAVKQDLVISAYKPNGGFEERFVKESDEEGVWDFVRTHLEYLPVAKEQQGELLKVPERDPRILFDQLVAYFVRNLRDVPVSSKEFQEGLLERFAERDGMIFLPEQVAGYDKVRISSKQLKQLSIFVDDEASAIEWLRQLINEKPQSYQDIHPKFINELSGWKKAEEQLELSKLLEQNFIKYDGEGPLPPQIHSYLSTNFKEMRNLSKDDPQLIKKAKDRWYVPNPEREEDLQKLRERDLLKQFEEYKEHTGRKLKTVRMEAVRCGFKKAWQDRDYPTIIQVAEKIPQNLLQEDQKLLMWYDQAQTRHSDESLF